MWSLRYKSVDAPPHPSSQVFACSARLAQCPRGCSSRRGSSASQKPSPPREERANVIRGDFFSPSRRA
eukprot:384586-Pyramimonas_sp.AAC.1